MINNRWNLVCMAAGTAAVAVALMGCTGDDGGGGTSGTTAPSGGGSGGSVDGASSTEPLALPQSGACGDAFFWAATAAGDLAVTVQLEARERSDSEPTVVDFTVPDPAVAVTLQTGTELVQAFCNDLLDQNHEVQAEHAASEGTGNITLEPIAEGDATCGITGELHVEGLAFEDGTEVEVDTIDIQSDDIGCYAG